MKRLFYIFIIGAALLLTACGPSEEEIVEQLEKESAAQFESESTEPNETLTHFSLYLPEGYKIDTDDETNVVIRQTDQIYLLFHNPFEDKQSKTYYESLELVDDATYLQSFEGDDYFAYIYLRPLESDYELQVGIGGTKITTQTPLDQVETEVNQLIKILSSIKSADDETSEETVDGAPDETNNETLDETETAE